MTAIDAEIAPGADAAGPAPVPTPARRSGFGRLRSSVVMRFASVGVLNTAVDFGLYVALFALGMSPVPANFISTSAGLAVSFLGNSRYVFRTSGPTARQVALFLVTAGIGIWLIQPVVIVAVTAAATSAGFTTSWLVGAAAKFVAIGVAAVWNYYLYSRVVFRRSRSRQDGPTA